jgi:flagellar M-ring protein FliF
VTLQTKSGRSLDNNQVQAITHLVASSVEGLKPANVVVVDTQGNLLASGDTASGAGGSGSQATDQRAAEQAAARQVQQKVQAMLDSVLGPNKSVVQASVSMDWSSKDTTTQTYDPTPSAVRSSQHVQESYTTAGSTTGGIPGLQSNLPTAVPTLANGQTPLEYQHSEDTNNYELSQTQTHEVVTPGTIKQISLAVLVDGVSDTGQLNAIRSAAGAAAGIDTNRGDNLSVQSLKFDRSYYDEQQAAMDSAARTDLYTRIGTGVAAALLLAGLLWYFSRLVRRMHQTSSDTWKPLMVPGGGAPPLLQGAGAQPALTGSLEALASVEAALQSAPPPAGSLPKEASAFKETKPAKESRPAKENKPAGPEAQQRDVLAKEMEQMQRGLAHVTEENPATVAEIIQMWMHEQGSGNE